MKITACLAALLFLSSCALGQNVYDSESIKQCRALPTPNERLQCERDARDASSDRRYDEARGMTRKGRYTLPEDLCPAEDEDACDFD